MTPADRAGLALWLRAAANTGKPVRLSPKTAALIADLLDLPATPKDQAA